MSARVRAFGLVTLVGGLIALGMIPITGAGAAALSPLSGARVAHGAGIAKPVHHHPSAALNRVAQPAVATGSSRSQATAAGTPLTGPGSLLRGRSGRLLVDIRVNRTDQATLVSLRSAGAGVTFTSSANHDVTAEVAPVDLARVGDVAGVEYISQIYTPMVAGASRLSGAIGAGPATSASTCSPIISEGDTMLNAAAARSRYAIDGTGVTVGVLSDSFGQLSSPTSAADDTASGDLPGATNPCGHLTPVNVVDDTASGGEDEGRAMAQMVHDLAPGANLAFATAFTGEDAFASNIQALASSAGAKVIVDDVTYFDEPMYQDGVVANAVSSVTTAGVAYFSSAANNNLVIGGHDVGSYQATNGYRPTPCPTMTGTGTETLLDCHNFNPAGTDPTYAMTVRNGGVVRIDLQWAEPLFGVGTDLDLFLINSSGAVLADSEDDNLASGHPFELLQWQNTSGLAQTVRLVIGRYAGTARPRLKFVHLENGSTAITSLEYATSSGGDVIGPTIFGHNGAADAGSVAALPYDDANTPEYYSSHGPVTLLFGPIDGTTPASKLASPQVLAKPDFAATDCVRNTFFGYLDGSNWRFCGTSDAAPHAAAVAALLRQRDPALAPAQVRSALASSAAAVTNGSAASTGAGQLDADAANGLTTTTLSASAETAQPGQSVTLTATVTGFGSTPTGTVTFTDGTATLETVPLDGAGQATVATSALAIGNHPIKASYAGDATDDPSMSPTVTAAIIDVASAPTSPAATAIAGAKIRVTWAAPATTNNSPLTSYRVYRSTTAGVPGSLIATVSASTTSYPEPASLTNGTRYYYEITAINAAGESAPSTQVSAVADSTVPVVSVTSPASLFQLSRTVTVRYSATDTISGIANYDVRYRVAAWNGGFGAYNTTTWPHVTATSESLTASPGHQYCFSIRARDKAGNTSSWSPDRCTVLPLDDRSLTATTAGWSRTTSSAAYLGTLTRTTTLGAKLQLTGAQTDRIALVVAQCSTCGSVAIYINGGYWRTVSTYASTTHYAVLLIPMPFNYAAVISTVAGPG